MDGNKRTALAGCLVFFSENGLLTSDQDRAIHAAYFIRYSFVKTVRIQSPFHCQNYAFRKGDHRPLTRTFSLGEITFPSSLKSRWQKIRERVRALIRSQT